MAFRDFAHALSKLKATQASVAGHTLTASPRPSNCTRSALEQGLRAQYKHGLDAVDHAIVYFDPAVVAHKQLPPLDVDFVRSCFAREDRVIVSAEDLERRLMEVPHENHVLLLMSSGRFGGANVTPAPRPATSSE